VTAGASLPPPWRTRWRVRIGYPVAIACFAFARPTPLMLACGATVAAAGLLIRGAAAGHLRKHESLATSGPYEWTRNPLYFGSMVLGAGFLLATASWIAAAVAVLYVLVFYPGVIGREEEELRAEYGQAFDDYARRVPRFWPRPPAGASATAFAAASAAESAVTSAAPPAFSWSQYRRNREYQALIGAVFSFALLAAEMLLWRPR
jgi:Phospholipid methyltransferase